MRQSLLTVVTLLLATIGLGQDRNGLPGRYIASPPENILLTVASLPDCPIQFENARLLIDINKGGLAISAQVRNVGTKAVRRYQPVIWTSAATGGSMSGSVWSSGKAHDKVIMPGQVITEDADIVIVPLTQALRDRFKLQGPMKAVVVLMVERVVFDDGSVYSAESISKALLEHFEKLAP